MKQMKNPEETISKNKKSKKDHISAKPNQYIKK